MRAGQLKRRPGHLQNFTGLSVEQFEELVEALRAEVSRSPGLAEPRQRAVGGGRKTKLELEDQMVVTLMYYRLYLTQVLGYLCDLDDSNVSRVVNRVRPLLLGVLPLPVQETPLLVAPEQKPRKRIATLAELLGRHPEFKEVLKGATEQADRRGSAVLSKTEVPKPKDKTKRQGHYAGKQKRHTLVRAKPGPSGPSTSRRKSPPAVTGYCYTFHRPLRAGSTT